MVNTNYPVVAPMLDTLSLYSNYWCGMGLDYYYRRTDEYKPIRERENKGCHRVIVVHSCFMVDLRQVESQRLTFKPEKINGYNGPHDDVITFAISGYWTGTSNETRRHYSHTCRRLFIYLLFIYFLTFRDCLFRCPSVHLQSNQIRLSSLAT